MPDFNLLAPDLSPLHRLGDIKRQEQQMAVENERRNRLDQLAFQQFEEAKKQNQLANQRADSNADTNRINAETNRDRFQAGEEFRKLELDQLRNEIAQQQLESSETEFNLHLGAVGMPMEVVFGSMETGQPPPEEMIEAMTQSLDDAATAFEGGPLSGNFKALKKMAEKALSTGSAEDIDAVTDAFESIKSFNSGQDSMSEMERVKLEREKTLAERDQFRLDTERSEVQEEQEFRQTEGNNIVSTLEQLLGDDDALKAATGWIGARANWPGGKASLWADKFDTLMKNLTLDKMQVFVGAMSEGERRFAQEATGLNRHTSDKRVREVLQGYLKMFQDRGFGGDATSSSEGTGITLSPFTQQILEQ